MIHLCDEQKKTLKVKIRLNNHDKMKTTVSLGKQFVTTFIIQLQESLRVMVFVIMKDLNFFRDYFRMKFIEAIFKTNGTL